MSNIFHVYDTILQEEFSEHEVVSMLRDAGNFLFMKYNFFYSHI